MTEIQIYLEATGGWNNIVPVSGDHFQYLQDILEEIAPYSLISEIPI